MKKILFLILLFTALGYPQATWLYPKSVHWWHLADDVINDSLATVDTVIVIVQDSIADIYPIPHDSLDIDTSWVIPGDGLGGGSAVEIGDTITHVVNVDGVTTIIVDDTVRADTTNLATQNFVNDTTKIVAQDTSQQYFWRSKSGFKYPQDFQTSQDSVSVCYFTENSTLTPYLQANLQSAASDSHYVFPIWYFNAPRDVADIAGTLINFVYKTTSADTLDNGVKLYLFKLNPFSAATKLYEATGIVASTSWDTLSISKTDGTVNTISADDHFAVMAQIKCDGDTVYVAWLEQIWE
jgi:hypothetical protein